MSAPRGVRNNKVFSEIHILKIVQFLTVFIDTCIAYMLYMYPLTQINLMCIKSIRIRIRVHVENGTTKTVLYIFIEPVYVATFTVQTDLP